jgi:L-galactose dehydrogenase/L-glyceraldehyde 3-phosphate reductase
MLTMEYRILGRTGLRVSEIGFGCGNVGGLIIRGTQGERVEAVKRAVELGINYFDTAPSYGDGRSEANLGEVLDELQPDVVVATKVRIGGEDLKDIEGAVERSLEKSLARLKLDSVDVLQLHSRIAMERDGEGWRGSLSIDDVLGENGVADAFEAMRSRGLVRFIGFTGLGEAEALHMVVDSDRFDVVQAYFNLLNPSAGWDVPYGFRGYDFGRLIDRAAERGMGVAAIRVMAAGAIGGKKARRGYAAPYVRGPMVPGGEYGEDEDRASRLDFLVEGDVESLPQAAVRFVLMHMGVSVVLVGFSDLGQVEEAAACSGRGPLPEASMGRLRGLW